MRKRTFQVRVSAEELGMFREAARGVGLPLSGWVRERLLWCVRGGDVEAWARARGGIAEARGGGADGGSEGGASAVGRGEVEGGEEDGS